MDRIRTMEIKYRLKSRPGLIRKIGSILCVLGFLIVAIGSICSLTPEIRTMTGLESWLIVSLGAFGLAFIYTGFLLRGYDWRQGVFTLDEKINEIKIQGQFPVLLRLASIYELTVLNSKHGLNRSIQIKTMEDVILIRFANEDVLLAVIESLVKKVESFPNRIINNISD